MDERKDFIKIFEKAENKYQNSAKRLAGEGWDSAWKSLIITIMSAQSRDETTIEVGENLFKRYSSIKKLAKAKEKDLLHIFKKLNYNKTKAKNIIRTSNILIKEFKSKVPENIDDLIKLPGVGRKTANLIITEVFGKDGICVDTHVHRLSNVLGLVSTKTPEQTEIALRHLAPRKYWSRINRIFVLWGKECSGRDKKKLLECLEK